MKSDNFFMIMAAMGIGVTIGLMVPSSNVMQVHTAKQTIEDLHISLMACELAKARLITGSIYD